MHQQSSLKLKAIQDASTPHVTELRFLIAIKNCIDSSYKPTGDSEWDSSQASSHFKGNGLGPNVKLWVPDLCVLTFCMYCFLTASLSLCPKGTFLKTKLYCVPDCGPGYYGDTSTNTCQKCSSKCRTCKDGGLDDLCTSCNSPFFLRGEVF